MAMRRRRASHLAGDCAFEKVEPLKIGHFRFHQARRLTRAIRHPSYLRPPPLNPLQEAISFRFTGHSVRPVSAIGASTCKRVCIR
jgi:hypothetical protein